MTLKTNARIAGFMFLLYIIVGIGSMILFGQATRGAEGTAAELAAIAENQTKMGLGTLLTLLTFLIAITLAVSLYALTRDEDRDLAILALCCRVGEGVIAAIATIRPLALVAIATAGTPAGSTDGAATIALGGLLLKMGGFTALIAASCFAFGSTIYSYLFLRARSIPLWLAWLGLFASLLLVVVLPLRLVGFVEGQATMLVWLPMLVFELVLAFWLILKGVAVPVARTSPPALAERVAA